MSLPWLLILALGCQNRPAPARLQDAPSAQPTLELGPGGASVTRLLDQLGSAALTLPQSNLPEGSREPGVFVLDDGWSSARTGKRDRKVWVRPCPVRLSQQRYTGAPIGMRLLRDGAELPYAGGLNTGLGADGSWEVQGGQLVIAGETSPEDWATPPVLEHKPTATQEQRLNLASSGLEPAEFARMEVTLDRLTRQALLLPAPGEAVFEVAIPMGASLRFGWGIAPPPAMAEGGTAGFVVTVDGQEIWRGKGEVDEDWQEARVDLAAFAGKTVKLAFRTEPDGDPAWDYAAFATPEIVGPKQADGPRRVVVVGIDTLRPDHLGTHGYKKATSPGMDLLAEQSIVFDRAFAPAPRTRPSFRTATTGRWPYPALESPTIGETLAAAGFSTGGVVANVHLAPKMGFNDGFGWWEYENSAYGEDQVDRALSWLGAHADEDSFLFLHLMDPHLFYLAPRPFLNLFTGDLEQGPLGDRYNRWMVLREVKRRRLKDDHKAHMEARYDGEIAYTDYQLMRFVTELDRLPGETLLVVHSDHGEEFWDHDSYEHNHTLYNELVRVLLWIRPPGGWGGGPHRVSQPVSLADIAPTIYDIVGIAPDAQPKMDGLSLVPYLDSRRVEEIGSLSATLADRPLHVGYLMYDTERWGVIDGDYKYILHTVSGQEELYDLIRDPTEQNNLARVRQDDLPRLRARLAEATGWPVGLGWRFDITGISRPFEVRFEEPVLEAGVIDPEASRERRANLEWGERPLALPEDVATVTVSEDGLVVRVTPGADPDGTLYVLGPDVDARGVIVDGEEQIPLQPALRVVGGGRVRFRSGAIIVPKESEADYLHLDFGSSDDDASIEALRELGYME